MPIRKEGFQQFVDNHVDMVVDNFSSKTKRLSREAIPFDQPFFWFFNPKLNGNFEQIRMISDRNSVHKNLFQSISIYFELYQYISLYFNELMLVN